MIGQSKYIVFTLQNISATFFKNIFLQSIVLLKSVSYLCYMTKTEYIRISKTGRVPMFKEMIGLVENFTTSELSDFCIMMHPNATKTSVGNQCKVDVHSNGKSYFYKLYNTCIIKTDLQTGKKTMYKL